MTVLDWIGFISNFLLLCSPPKKRVIALDSKRKARDEFLQRLPEELLNCQVESKVYRVEHTYSSQNKENEDFLFLNIAKK